MEYFPPDYSAYLYVPLPMPAQVMRINKTAVNFSRVNSQYFQAVQDDRPLEKTGKLYNFTYLYFISVSLLKRVRGSYK